MTNFELSTSKSSDESSNYQIRPNLSDSFKVATVKEIILQVMHDLLDGKEYSKTDAAIWTRAIVNEVSKRVGELNMPRYKHVIQVMLAEQTGSGCRYMARCRWDAETDSKVSEFYQSESLFCIVTVFGVYLY